MSNRSPKKSKLVKRHGDVTDVMRGLMEHLQDGLSLGNLRLCERYLDGEISLLLRLRWRVDSEYITSFQVEKRSDSFRQKDHGILLSRELLKSRPEQVPHLCQLCGIHRFEPILTSESEQETMLVNIVQPMNLPENFSLTSRVRFDLPESFFSTRRKALFYSPNTGFKFLGKLTNREIYLIKRPVGISPDTYEPISDVVKGASQVLDGISRDERNISVKRGSSSEFIDVISRLRIVLTLDAVVPVSKFPPEVLEIEDVFFGPF